LELENPQTSGQCKISKKVWKTSRKPYYFMKISTLTISTVLKNGIFLIDWNFEKINVTGYFLAVLEAVLAAFAKFVTMFKCVQL